ncbi:MAG TPA: hypothetical protein ENI27_09365 [bacterium]|nr:hypothetical protein [bacterium]
MSKDVNWKGKLINGLSQYRAYYDKGIAVLAIIRNMELTDLAIMTAAAKYLFGDHISTLAIIFLAGCYWVVNVCVNLAVGWFWERNNGWEIEAKVFGKRVAPGRTVLVCPEGKPYDARDIGLKPVYYHDVPSKKIEVSHGN